MDGATDTTVVMTDNTKVRLVEGYYIGQGPLGPAGKRGPRGATGATGPQGPPGVSTSIDSWMSSFTAYSNSLVADTLTTVTFTPVVDLLGVQYASGQFLLTAGTKYLVMFGANFDGVSVGNCEIRLVPSVGSSFISRTEFAAGTLEMGAVFAPSTNITVTARAKAEITTPLSSGWLDVFVLSSYPLGTTGSTGPVGPAGAAGAAGPDGPEGPPRTLNQYQKLFLGGA